MSSFAAARGEGDANGRNKEEHRRRSEGDEARDGRKKRRPKKEPEERIPLNRRVVSDVTDDQERIRRKIAAAGNAGRSGVGAESRRGTVAAEQERIRRKVASMEKPRDAPRATSAAEDQARIERKIREGGKSGGKSFRKEKGRAESEREVMREQTRIEREIRANSGDAHHKGEERAHRAGLTGEAARRSPREGMPRHVIVSKFAPLGDAASTSGTPRDANGDDSCVDGV